MKLSSQEEYGLRCLLHLARSGNGGSLTIPEISQAEGLSIPNVAKLMRLLRIGGLVRSVRGQAGGYTLARSASAITVGEVLDLLGGRFFGPQFCERHSGRDEVCKHSVDCSLRTLWTSVQNILEETLGKTTLEDVACTELEMRRRLSARNGSQQAAPSAAES